MRTVFLDAGLTLLRAEPSLGAVYTRVAARHGRVAAPEAFERAAAAAFHEVAREHRDRGEDGLRTSDALERDSWYLHAGRVAAGVPGMEGVDFDAWFEDLYDEFGSARAWTPFEDTVPALEALRGRGARLAVVSNWDHRLHRILEDHALTRFFEAVIVSAEVGWRKPHPAIFRAALEALAVRPEEALHAGDSAGDDVAGAEAAGIRPVLLDRDGGRAVDGAVAVVRDLHGIATLLG